MTQQNLPPDRAVRHEPSPVDLPGSTLVGGRPLGWTAVTIATACLFLLLTNAETLDAWAAEQTPSPTMVTVTDATERWQAFTAATGLSGTRDAMHGLWKRWQAARFAGQPPAEVD